MADVTYQDLEATVGQSSGSPLKDAINGAADFVCGLHTKYPDGLFGGSPYFNDITTFTGFKLLRKEILDSVCGQAGRPKLPPRPFMGGQCATKYYFMYDSGFSNAPPFIITAGAYGGADVELIGPITNISYVGYNPQTSRRQFSFSNSAGETLIGFGVFNNDDGVVSKPLPYPMRRDGEPDNCGDPSNTISGAIPNNEKSGYITITDKDGNVIQIPVNFDPDINGDLKIDLGDTEIIFGKDGVSIKQKSGQGDPEGWDKKDPIDEKTPRERLKDIEEDLKEAQEGIDKLSEILGIEEYPLSLPASLISKDEGFLGNLIPNSDVSIPNLTRFIAWYVERFDEIVGQWEIPIEIKDTDPSTPGDQPRGIKLPNLAEATAEIFLLAFQAYSNTEILLNLLTRNLIETGTDKQQNFITYKLLQSLTDWVGFKQKDMALDMPLTFTLNKTRYDEILQESTVKVNCVEFDDKFGLEADLMRFREGVAILQAVYKRKLDPNGDIKGQILKYLLDTLAGVDKVSDANVNLNALFNQIENAFTDIASVGDPTQPYGDAYTQRPKIRDLTQLDSDGQP